MIIDTSAVMAMLYEEPEAPAIEEALAAGRPVISAASLVEASIVCEGRGGAPAGARLDALLLQAKKRDLW